MTDETDLKPADLVEVRRSTARFIIVQTRAFVQRDHRALRIALRRQHVPVASRHSKVSGGVAARARGRFLELSRFPVFVWAFRDQPERPEYSRWRAVACCLRGRAVGLWLLRLT